MSTIKIRNIGLFAHVDAGKTTITESLLFSNGSIRDRGDVNKGTSKTDFLNIEKEKGISIRTAGVSFKRNDITINLVDTPGHTDFSSETERALLAIDGAVLVVSAVEGVQAHTETLWEMLRKFDIPTIIFINKIDRQGADTELVLEEIYNTLTKNAIPLQTTINEGTQKADVESNVLESAIEKIIELDDNLLEQFLEGETFNKTQLNEIISTNTKSSLQFPVLYGVAKEQIGTDELCDSIINYLPAPNIIAEKELSGIVFKVEHNKTLGKLAHIRLYGGKLTNRDSIFNSTKNCEEKVTLLKKIFTQKYEDIDELNAGNIGLIAGLKNTQAGDIIGKDYFDGKYSNALLDVPLLKVKAIPSDDADFFKLIQAFSELTDEDPNLQTIWLTEQKEFHVNVKGKIHIEILQQLIKERFNLDVIFNEPVVIYMETPAKPAEGYVRYWMPKPCWAIMKFSIVPGKRGSGVKYSSEVSVNKIKQRYQNQIANAISKSLSQGIKGWEVTDIEITLIDGEDHEVHTHPHDFTVATPMGIMDGLVNSETKLLEPILNFRITAPEEFLGDIANDLTKMKATFANPQFDSGKFTLTGKLPVATSLDYPIKLASVTGGKGKISTMFDSYQECEFDESKTVPYRGISPLDTSKYILYARNAITNNY